MKAKTQIKMERIIICESEACNIQELIDLFELTPENIENGEIPDLFRSDPDYFSFGIGEKHIHKIPFVEILDKYIIVPDDYIIEAISDYTIKGISDKCKEMLIKFFNQDFRTYFTAKDNTWEAFNSFNFGIAYRGGKGYSYEVWSYKNKRK